MKIHRNLLWVGWVLFLICLVLPSITISRDVLYGFQAGVWAIIIFPNLFESFDEFQVAMMGVANIVAILCPLLLLEKRKYFHGLFFVFLSMGFVFGVKLSFVDGSIGAPYHAGYYVWVVSFLVSLIGIGYNIVKNHSYNSDHERVDEK